jgi:radical SAM superfamily enzyme
MNRWVLKDRIKRGIIQFELGDEVICFDRKVNGHPRSIKDGISYVVTHLDEDGHMTVVAGVDFVAGNGIQHLRIHKMYMMKKSELRDIKLAEIFKNT